LQAAVGTGDPVLADAAAAAASAGQGGQVTQYLAGVPALLDRWAGRGGDSYGQAVITAAMDAARFGYASVLPAALVQEAAVGYLTASPRTKDIAAWGDRALDWATTELRGAVRALQPVPPPSGTGVAGYQVADYLDQYGRRTREDQLGPASLWDALITYTTSPNDVRRLAQAAVDRGLYRYASALWTTAATLGSTYAAAMVVDNLRQVNPGDAARAARWAAEHASLDDLSEIGRLLTSVRKAGTGDETHILVTRAGQANLDDPMAALALLRALHEAGADDMAQTLATRAAKQASLHDPNGTARLLESLREIGSGDAIATLLARDPAGQASLQNLRAVGQLLQELHKSGADDDVQALATRAAQQASLHDPNGTARLLESLREIGAGDAIATLLARDPAGQAILHGPKDGWDLYRQLLEVDNDAAQALMTRSNGLLDPGFVALLRLQALHRDGADDDARALATHAAGQANLHDPDTTAWLLRAMREVGADDAITTLLARDPVGQADIQPYRLHEVGNLVHALSEVGADDDANALATRAANLGHFRRLVGHHGHPDEGSKYRFGREPDDTPSPPWSWQQPTVTTNEPSSAAN
jgi:L-fucose mutarotase/ribose pyranase (RbsD/FucU family)